MELVNTSDLVQITTTGAMKFNFKKADNEFPLILLNNVKQNRQRRRPYHHHHPHPKKREVVEMYKLSNIKSQL